MNEFRPSQPCDSNLSLRETKEDPGATPKRNAWPSSVYDLDPISLLACAGESYSVG